MDETTTTSAPSPLLGADRSDPLEDGVRGRVRASIEAILEAWNGHDLGGKDIVRRTSPTTGVGATIMRDDPPDAHRPGRPITASAQSSGEAPGRPEPACAGASACLMLVPGRQGAAGVSRARVLYESANGDRWLLVREGAEGRVLVRHEPNAPSGGAASERGVGEFLARGGHGPEHAELLRLIGTLVPDG